MSKKYFSYHFSKEGIKCVEVDVNDFNQVSYGFIIEETDLTDYTRLVPTELRHRKRYTVNYCRCGKPLNIEIDQLSFKHEITFDESITNHPTLTGSTMSHIYSFNIEWYNPFEKKNFSIKLHSEFTYNYGIVGLYAIYFLYITYRQSESWENDCKYLWAIINAKSDLFDYGGSSISFNNFEYGKFVTGVIRLYEEFQLEADDYPFMKHLFNTHIKQALNIWENERKRLYLNTNNFHLD